MVLPKDGPGLDGDVKHLGFFIVKTEQGTRQDEVTRGRNGQKFGQTFHHAHHGGFEQEGQVHGVPSSKKGELSAPGPTWATEPAPGSHSLKTIKRIFCVAY